MTSSRSFTLAIAAALVAVLALLLSLGIDEPRTVLAGPCAEDPKIYDDTHQFPGPEGILDIFALNGQTLRSRLFVDTNPSELPLGKDPVTISVKGTLPIGIDVAFNPSESDGTFSPDMFVTVGQGVTSGQHTFQVEAYCHERTKTYTVEVWVNTCPLSGSSIAGAPDKPENCQGSEETPTPEPSPTPTSEPTPSDTPEPTEPAGQQVVWGNHNCSGNPLEPPDPVDALLNLRHDAGLSTNTGDCPDMGQVVDVLNASLHPWGDIDCSGAADPVDALKLLRFDAALSVAQGPGCPALGASVLVSAGPSA